MDRPIISVRNLSKNYRLYAKPSARLKEVIWPLRPRHTLFHALSNVSFDVYPGEYLGILGQNGAGKSTLLQIISGVLTPTSGVVEVNGRVASLLELGAGFNPELTGRENVVFQMQLAGIENDVIPVKLEEVQSFAEIGEFFDHPVKLYSSGMFARAAFSSAILTEPEILIVDEALAVGDAKFQKKCLDRMRHMKESGVTIILVSHDIFGTKAASSRMIMLSRGKIECEGSPDLVTACYLQSLFPNVEEMEPNSIEIPGDSVKRKPLKEIAALNSQIIDFSNETPTKIWGAGGAKLRTLFCEGLEKPNIFFPDQTFLIRMSFVIQPETIKTIAEKNANPLFLHFGIRVDLPNGMPICAVPGVNNDKAISVINWESKSIVSAIIYVKMPNLAQGDYFFSPGLTLGTYSENNYTPLAVYENMLQLFCKQSKNIHGIFEICSSVELCD